MALDVKGDFVALYAQNAALLVFYHSGDFTTAASADTAQHQHPFFDLTGEIADSCNIAALDAVNIVENFETDVSRNGRPDPFGFGCKITIHLMKSTFP